MMTEKELGLLHDNAFPSTWATIKNEETNAVK